jgi:hypothetical protein
VLQGQDSARMPGLSPEPVAHLSQHRLLPLLLASATAGDACGAVRFGQAVTGIAQAGSGLRVAVLDAEVCAQHSRISFPCKPSSRVWFIYTSACTAAQTLIPRAHMQGYGSPT